MSDLYLICHKVRGVPAFDVAQQIPCPICQSFTSATSELVEARRSPEECNECDNGVWWISPTWGYRCYPYWSLPLAELSWGCDWATIAYEGIILESIEDVPDMPSTARDLFPINDRPPEKSSLFDLMQLGPKAPIDFKRRV